MIRIHEASFQDRGGAPEVIRKLMETAPKVEKLWADGSYHGPKL